ncbi:MAG TPA: potassium channel protein [Syntrophales bacterium]|nr:potassium channel protein [Syntrophales bacterium]
MNKRLAVAFAILFMTLLIGTVGYHFFEDFDLFRALYLTIVTVSTVGYGDVYARTTGGMIFTLVLIITGVGTMFYTASLFAETLVENRLQDIVGKGKLKRTLRMMKDHYLICGCGRIGLIICRELAAEKIPFVVIEKDPEVIRKIEAEGFLYCQGDGTEDGTLLAAGIERARGIVCVLPTDAQNLYVILTAKELNPRLFVLSRSEEEQSEHRLLRAGADRVISPYKMGGMRMAMALIRPAMLDFIEISTMRQSLELRMAEVSVGSGAAIVGKNLGESEIRRNYGLIIVAVKKESGKMVFNPEASYLIEQGDKLIALGEDGNVMNFARSCAVRKE